jgi:hypothetical protein
MALVVEDATIWAVWVATATAGGMPRKIRSGGHEEPAADAEQARDEAHGRAHPQDQENADRHLGDREIKLHAVPPAAVMASEWLPQGFGPDAGAPCPRELPSGRTQPRPAAMDSLRAGRGRALP